jgi:prephenate dehydrogenase
MFRTLAIVGVGLIGGSIALAARARGVAQQIIGIGPSRFHLEAAVRQGMLDTFDTELKAAGNADAAIVCTPVNQIAQHVAELVVITRPGTLITDVGSTKAGIVRTLAAELRDGFCFVGGHPLAGSEKSGPQFADARLFENRLVILTPNRHFNHDAAPRATAMWEALGARVKLMSPEEHDRAMAITSHLPHLVAAALAAMLPDELRELAASGFRDTTRIAGGDPRLWLAIVEQNQQAIDDALNELISNVAACFTGSDWGLDRTVKSDVVLKLLTDAKRNRDALGS